MKRNFNMKALFLEVQYEEVPNALDLMKQHKMGREKDDGRKNCSSSSFSHPQNKSQKGNCLGCLPEDALFDILTWLPAECLLSSARYTCKYWAAMICSSDFAEKHLLRSKPGIFLQSTKRPYGAWFLDVKDNGEFGVTTLNPDFPGRFVNSCDGLIVLYENARGVLNVTNPVTKQRVKVPMLLSPNLMYPPCAVVRVPRTGEFKLFASRVLTESEVCYCHWHVLRLGKDSAWTRISVEPGDFEFRCTPIYTGGNDLYWITEKRVIVMDVEKETFQQFPLPQGPHRWYAQYLKMENRLASVIWVAGEGFQMQVFDPDSGNWNLYHEMKCLDYPTGDIEFLSEFFALWINQELIIKLILLPTLNTLFFSYDMKTGGRLKKIDAIQEGSFDVGLHTNSLVSWKNTLPLSSLRS
ncbi:uncharacterized protein LOC129287540 [Prosopis cineraria]|uniref:uncharacterized protein LOC129287540 n=1 Tax=Prosopis cineraria TaxID=364024 RepID=UPI00240F0D42|nr:uncharacterized protein LOC129287540 [Prosopis cineraria]